MRPIGALLLLLLVGDLPQRPEPALPYFTNVRDVQITEPGRQNFFVVDEELWNHSRPDLGDLRLYDGDSPVQYAVSEQRAGIESEEVEAKIINLGNVSGHAEFDVNTAGLHEYDRIRLRLDAHDFIATASVSGGGAAGKATEVQLPASTLYDFTKEQLGSNFLLKLPTSTFAYLHVRLSPGIRPQQVKGATIYNLREQKASWTRIGSCGAPEQKPHITVIHCQAPPQAPLSRISFEISPAQVNFRRSVAVEEPTGEQFTAGEISRVRMNRGGTLVTNEELYVNLSRSSGSFNLLIDNGDNAPLSITGTQPLTVQSRIYFDPQSRTSLKLYYGDAKLLPPIYDYARFFRADSSPAQAQLGEGTQNARYTGRPDERPWSERHMGILWTAMIVAVLALAFLALRGLRTQSIP